MEKERTNVYEKGACGVSWPGGCGETCRKNLPL